MNGYPSQSVQHTPPPRPAPVCPACGVIVAADDTQCPRCLWAIKFVDGKAVSRLDISKAGRGKAKRQPKLFSKGRRR